MEKTKVLIFLIGLQMSMAIGYVASKSSGNQTMMDFFMIADCLVMISTVSIIVFKKENP